MTPDFTFTRFTESAMLALVITMAIGVCVFGAADYAGIVQWQL